MLKGFGLLQGLRLLGDHDPGICVVLNAEELIVCFFRLSFRGVLSPCLLDCALGYLGEQGLVSSDAVETRANRAKGPAVPLGPLLNPRVIVFQVQIMVVLILMILRCDNYGPASERWLP